MSERLFGVETEYAFTPFRRNAEILTEENRERAVMLLMHVAREQLPHLPGYESKGLFLQNGSRFYLDCGRHPELATPECTNPWDAVRYVIAGERILQGLTGEVASLSRQTLDEAAFFRCNVDYSGTCATWGCHESYLHCIDPAILPDQLIPHLVSRIIYCGAGGFNSFSPGLEFLLSPRVPHLVAAVSGDSTGNRGIFHTKDEPLCREGYHRVHILCGESTCSETAAWLKIASTALVIAAIEDGARPGSSMRLKDPIDALRRFARDVSCRATAETADERNVTAMDIQELYLNQVEARLDASTMPSWAGAACRVWRSILDKLREDPMLLQTSHDAYIKYVLYGEFLRKNGFSWDSASRWTHVLSRVPHDRGRMRAKGLGLNIDIPVTMKGPIPEELKTFSALARTHGLKWEDIESFLALRRQLFEIDTRFGQLGNDGIFSQLSRSGVLEDAHFPGVDNIEHAVANPPDSGRARLRGEWIRQLAGKENGCVCEWNGVWNLKAGQMLDLSDPFATEVPWKKLKEDRPDGDLLHSLSRRLLAERRRQALREPR